MTCTRRVDAWDAPAEVLSLRVLMGPSKRYTFDVEVKHEDANTCYLTLAPRRVPHERRGCVVMRFDPSVGSDDPAVVILAVAHDDRCSAPGTPPLEKKYGTRAMMLGAAHAMVFLARDEGRWPHLRSFQLDDESTFRCDHPVPGKKVVTFAADLLSRDRTYYERHLNAELLNPAAASSRSSAIRRVKEPVDMNGDEFVSVLIQGVMNGATESDWISRHSKQIAALVDAHMADSLSWRILIRALSDRYGCAFFACCTRQLIDFFRMNRMVGASYGVRFEDLPRATATRASSAIEVLLLSEPDRQTGGGQAATSTATRMRKRLGAARKAAFWNRFGT